MKLLSAMTVPLADLADVFNNAFSDYYMSINFTEASLKEYIRRHGLDLEASLAVEADGLLVGLLLSGHDHRTTWNAGMGIHPRWRGKGLGRQLLDGWLRAMGAMGIERALLEVGIQNLIATKLYRSCGFSKVRAYQGFEGRPTWQRWPAIHPDHVVEVTPRELIPIYRKGHSWQKRPDVMERLDAFTALMTDESLAPEGPGYLIFENAMGLFYIFDATPNRAGRALIEHAVRRERPRLLRVANAVDLIEEDFYRKLGFKPWIRNLEMVVRL